MLTAPLMARQGKVPPASTTPKPVLPAQLSRAAGQPAIGTLDKQTAYQGSQVNAKSANIVGAQGAHGQTPIQATKSDGLKRKKAYFNVADASPPKKRARARLPSPYPSASQVVSAEFGDLNIGDENQTTQAQDAPNLEKDASKLPGHSVATKDEAESKPSPKTAGGTDVVGKTRAKAADYDIGTRSIIQTAIGLYCATLLSNDPYAPPVKELEWAKAAWGLACDHHEVKIPHDAVVLKLVSRLRHT
ncbi:hypothetical protein JVT61DRAFT_3120 [Boletus reticuloceps]|nr:hypothetical protein JVT61DRAFT_3120 [Boletus reticuloceps]